ncbi:MAG TPA: Ig-like domain-containing protein [Candidatus Koribacter sp.]|jgi:hypothetical protein
MQSLFTKPVFLGSAFCAFFSLAVNLAGAGTTPSVTFVQPSGSSGTSPLTVAAQSNVSVREMQLYVDGVKYTQQYGNTFNAAVTLTPGTHRIAVQMLGSTSAVMAKAVKYVTISTPPPTTYANVVKNIQEMTSWQTCGACGNTSGNAALATYNMTRGLTTPAMDNLSTSTEFSISGKTPYTNAFWYIDHPILTTPVKSIVYDFYLYIPEATGNAPQAIEFQCQQKVNGYIYNFAWQANYKGKVWRTFDYVNRKWVATAIPFAGFTTGTWHHIIAQYHASGTNAVHDSLTVDGVKTLVNITRPAAYTGTAVKQLTNAFQLDMNGTPTPYAVYVDKMTVSYE